MLFEGWLSTLSPRKNVIFILLYRMSHFYNKFHRHKTLPCDIQNCPPANWPIRLLEINMRYNNVDCHPWESIVNLGSALVYVSSGWQSTMSPRKECDIYTHEQWKRNTQMYINISRIFCIYFQRGFLVILWIQKIDTILPLLLLTWNVLMFIRMRTFQP